MSQGQHGLCRSFHIQALVLLKLFSATKAARLITLPHIMNDERQKGG